MSLGFSKADLARREDEVRPVVERLAAAGCRFVQLEMPDLNGTLRGKIQPLAQGLSATGTGIGTVILTFKGGGQMCFAPPFVGSAETGFPKMIAVPDLSTAVALPWKRDVAAVICDYYLEDGTPCHLSPRHMLRTAEAELAALKYSVYTALEYEFYVMEVNDALMRERRYAELTPFQRGLDVWSLSKAPSFEELAKELMTRCESIGAPIETFHTEHGYGMFEYSFRPQTALKAADASARAKLCMRQLCAERNLAITYMAAKFFPSADSFGGDTFSGCHHNFSLSSGKENAFWDETAGGLSELARHAAGGILNTMPPFTLIFRPWVNSYRRNNHHLGAPENASWGKEHHLSAMRVVHGSAPHRLTRFEHRVPGSDVNPYLSLTAIMQGCLQGIRGRLEPVPYATGEVTSEKNGALLPRTMPEAIELFRHSPQAVEAFGSAFVEHFAIVKAEEWADFAKAVASPEAALQKAPVTDWEFARYFNDA
jgi:glutamine synthetase